jgi:hypothetical protein
MITIAQELVRRMGALEISGNIVAKLAGISTGECSMRLSGVKPLDADLAKRLLKLVDALEDLKRSKGVSINWKNVEEVRSLLRQRAESREAVQKILEGII